MNAEAFCPAVAVGVMLDNHNPDAAERFRRLFKNFSGRYPAPRIVSQLNSFWRIQLGLLPVMTISERSWLVEDTDDVTWVDYFEKNVLPAIVNNNLPQPLK